jgi:hypothetical protein
MDFPPYHNSSSHHPTRTSAISLGMGSNNSMKASFSLYRDSGESASQNEQRDSFNNFSDPEAANTIRSSTIPPPSSCGGPSFSALTEGYQILDELLSRNFPPTRNLESSNYGLSSGHPRPRMRDSTHDFLASEATTNEAYSIRVSTLEVLPNPPPSSISNNSKSIKPQPLSRIGSPLGSSSSPFPRVSRVRVTSPLSASHNRVHTKHVNESLTRQIPRTGISDVAPLNLGQYCQDSEAVMVPGTQEDSIVSSVPAGRPDPLQPPTTYSQPSFSPLAKE